MICRSTNHNWKFYKDICKVVLHCAMTTLPDSEFKIRERILHTPALDEIKNVVTPALMKNFAEASVEVVDCPDLTKLPFTLAAPGLGSNSKLIHIGGAGYLIPTVQREKLYDVQSLLKRINYNGTSFVIGAGAGPWPQLPRNCEMMMNVVVSPNGELKNETRLAYIDDKNQCVLQQSAESDTRCALLVDLYLSHGETGKVLKVYAKKRIGEFDFITTMQRALAAHYKDQLVGLGGAFLLKEGKARQHVMDDFSATPLRSRNDLDKWLHFYDMSAPLIAVGTFVSSETDLDLRVQHFHSFSHHNEGGHYHIDTTPDTVEYLGYFNIADCLYRVDQPPTRFKFEIN